MDETMSGGQLNSLLETLAKLVEKSAKTVEEAAEIVRDAKTTKTKQGQMDFKKGLGLKSFYAVGLILDVRYYFVADGAA